MINWILYPLSEKPNDLVLKVVKVFEKHYDQIKSESHVGLHSDGVLKIVADSLADIGFKVETGKKAEQKVKYQSCLDQMEDLTKLLKSMLIIKTLTLLLKLRLVEVI